LQEFFRLHEIELENRPQKGSKDLVICVHPQSKEHRISNLRFTYFELLMESAVSQNT